MLKNYLITTWRSLKRNATYSLINITGLALGMACCILIALFIREELSYDTFHENADRIVQVGSYIGSPDRSLNTPYPLAEVLEAEVPQVERATRVRNAWRLRLGNEGAGFAVIEDAKYAEPSFFDIFSFGLLAGDPATALSAPGSVVLTRSQVNRFFGGADPVGRTLQWMESDTTRLLTVTGVMADPPLNSSLQFSMLVSYSTTGERTRSMTAWRTYGQHTYALLRSADDVAALPGQLDALAEANYENSDPSASGYGFFGMPMEELYLTDLTANEGFLGSRSFIYLFGAVALFILALAGVNYVNMSTARAASRMKEVGVRKSLGASKGQLRLQFVGESVAFSLFSFLLACVLALQVLPWFNHAFGSHLEWDAMISFIPWMAAAAVVLGVAAGVYPALVLSQYAPTRVFRNMSGGPAGSALLRKVLVSGQFAVALALVFSFLVMQKQLGFMQDKELGFEGDQVVSIDLDFGNAWSDRERVYDALSGLPGVQSLSLAHGVPGRVFGFRQGHKASNFSPEAAASGEREVTYALGVIDEHYLELLDIGLVAGRGFSPDSDVQPEPPNYIMNRRGVENLGWTPEEAIGKPFGFNEEYGTIVGVTEDFHISSLRNDLEGVAFAFEEAQDPYGQGVVLAKLHEGDIPGTMQEIERQVKAIAPTLIFNYEFLDDRFDAMYRNERRLGQVIGMFTFLAIFIACLGLYGMVTFTVERRKKEVGIRKILGATVAQIVALLGKDFALLAGIGSLLALPFGWIAMNRWIDQFAYQAPIGAGVMLLALLLIALTVMLTVSWQSCRAAMQNPVDSLRSE